MRLNSRRYLSYVLLAAYAGISLLGEGLHSLMPEAGHHHHDGLYIVNCPSRGTAHADHDADSGVTSAEAVLTASYGDADSHICEICQFLFQAVGQPAEVASPLDWQPLVVATSSLPQPRYSSISLGPQTPRGPPVLG